MNTPAQAPAGTAPVQAPAGSAPRPDPLVLAAVAGLGALTLVLVIGGNGNVGLALAPVALTLLVLLVARAPLRHSLLVLGVLCLTLENPSEFPATGLWRSPLYVLGALLLSHLNLTIPIDALFFSGLDLVLVLLVATWVGRRMTASDVDIRGHVPPASPLRAAALLCICSIFFIWGRGLLSTGADFRFSLWQVFRVIYLPCVFLLYCAGLRGPSDSRAFGIALVCAALIRASLAVYIRNLFPDLEQMPHTTVHADSMLFADAFLLMLIMFFERPNSRTLLLGLGTLPILTWGMIANNRRLAFVEVMVGLIVLYFITPFTRLKKRIAQGVAICLPLIALYVAVGWSSSARVFGPVRTLRSIVDSGTDSSTLWRDWENYNLYSTIKAHPLLGTGFGHGYDEVVKLPDISKAYELYRFAPHNSVLGLLAYSGAIGFAGMWLFLALGVFFAVRSYRFSTTPRDRTTALVTVCILVTYLVHCYGDMGLGTWASVFMVGPALALVGKQAVATGAWPLRPRRGIAPVPPRTT
ncbi:MAG TPA: O-antigen ligase family protein [Myxococcales bacterium]|nr:O-antigen ligase family protein [Myxococcales bacterium]